MVIQELREGSSKAAIEYRKDNNISNPSSPPTPSKKQTPELLLKESFENIYESFFLKFIYIFWF